jgi:DNA-directed RNA polymerase subunit RPC12/RpoP
MKKEKERQRTAYKCSICEGPVVTEKLFYHMMFVVCKSCNAVVDYYNPLDEKEIFDYQI